MRNLVLILGDQLQADSSAFEGFDSSVDKVVMIESSVEAQYVWSHVARIALFLSAMRHFAKELRERGMNLIYAKEATGSLDEELEKIIDQERPEKIIAVMPGEYRVKVSLDGLIERKKLRWEWREDTHFYCSLDEFRDWVKAKKEIRMEFFYRYMRKKHQVLMDEEGEPLGGQWNYDDKNRKAFPKKGPGPILAPIEFAPDDISQEVLTYVKKNYANHPGSLEHFRWPVTRKDALEALEHFVHWRLGQFGTYQDAMWTNTPFAWHSLLSSSLNLKLISPKEVVRAAIVAMNEHHYDLTTVEGFIRQVIGWREFVRGMYFMDMPKMAEDNFYSHQRALPAWYWSGETKMACMRDAIGQTLEYGYAHHIQRLMLLGNFGLLAQIKPQEVCAWFLSVYVDAIEWVELPNTAGMALFANGGRFTSKPYIASGAYVDRMSNYCKNCTYQPQRRYGVGACPMTTLYWNFLSQHEKEFERNPRTKLMIANLQKIEESERKLISAHAQKLLEDLNQV